MLVLGTVCEIIWTERNGHKILSVRLWENSFRKMAKSKNHTANNQTYKDHRHRIQKPKKHRYRSTLGVGVSLGHIH